MFLPSPNPVRDLQLRTCVITLCDFFLRGHIKEIDYEPPFSKTFEERKLHTRAAMGTVDSV